MATPDNNPRCPFCQQPISPEDRQTACPACGTAHHADCWAAQAGCAVPGCTGQHAASADSTPPRQRRESPVWGIALLAAAVIFVALGLWLGRPSELTTAGIEARDVRLGIFQSITGVLITLGIFSILYRENPIFRFLEHIFIGLATGYGLVITYFMVIIPLWFKPMMPAIAGAPDGSWYAGDGQWWWWMALPIGLLFFTVYTPKWSWMNRFLISVMMGFFAGAALQTFMGTIGPQIAAAFRPPVTLYAIPTMDPGPNNWQIAPGVYLHLWWLLAFLIVLCVMAYFFFSVEHRAKWIRPPAVSGRALIMITLGVIFGLTVMGRFTLLIGRLSYLIQSVGQWWTMFAYWVGSLGK